MAIVNEDQLRKDLIRDEGIRRAPYFDTKGIVTFGIGRNLAANPLTRQERRYGNRIGFDSDEFIFFLFENDIREVLTELYQELPWLKEHPENVQRAVANMAFQMGVGGVLRFQKSLPLIKQRQYADAAKEMEDSQWFRKDSPSRAARVIALVHHET